MFYLFLILFLSGNSWCALTEAEKRELNKNLITCCQFFKGGNDSKVEELLEAGASPDAKDEKSGEKVPLSAVTYAIIWKNYGAIRILLSKMDTKQKEEIQKEGLTYLGQAIEMKDSEAVNIFLEGGVSVGTTFIWKKEKLLPLDFAKRLKKKEIVENFSNADNDQSKEDILSLESIVNIISAKHNELNEKLIEAVQQDNKGKVEKLLTLGASPLATDGAGKTALDLAPTQTLKNVLVRKYVNNGGCLLAEYKKGVTVLAHLIQQNFDISSFIQHLPTNWKSEVLPNGLTYLCQAIFSKNLASVKGFLEYEVFLGREVVFNGTPYFPLDFAKYCLTLDNNENQKVKSDRTEIVEVIYKEHMKLNDSLIELIKTYDEANDKEWICNLIIFNISMGASPLATNDAGKTALELAPTPEIKDLLITRCNELNQRLLEATKNENTNPYFKETLSLLGARDFATKKNEQGDDIEQKKELNLRLCTEIVIKNVPLESIKALLVAGACPDTCEKYKLERKNGPFVEEDVQILCPIFLAAVNQREDLVDLLIKHGANINQKRDGDGHTPLHTAVIRENREAVRILLKYGANPFEKIANGDTVSSLIVIDDAIKKMISKEINLQRTSIGLKAAGALSALTCLCCAWYESKDSKDKPIVTEEKNSFRKFSALLKRKKKTVAFALGAVAFFVADRFGVKALRAKVFSS